MSTEHIFFGLRVLRKTVAWCLLVRVVVFSFILLYLCFNRKRFGVVVPFHVGRIERKSWFRGQLFKSIKWVNCRFHRLQLPYIAYLIKLFPKYEYDTKTKTKAHTIESHSNGKRCEKCKPTEIMGILFMKIHQIACFACKSINIC